MPTYEYECKKCNTRFEKFHSISATPVKKCPECKGPVRLLISGGAGIISKTTISGSAPPPCAQGMGCSGGACPMAGRH